MLVAFAYPARRGCSSKLIVNQIFMATNRGKRDKMIGVWCTQNEHDAIKKRAKKSGLTKGRYVREVALCELPQGEAGADKYELIEEFEKLRKELGAIGNNINQIAKLGNQTGAFDRERYGDERQAIFQMRMNIDKAITELL